MPRRAREKSETGIYHVIVRGINKQNIFHDNDDRQQLFMVIARAKEKSDFKIYAYCFMNNHIHLLLHEGAETIGEVMKRVGSSYVYRYNQKYERIGYLFQDRYKSESVNDDAYLLTVLRYIHHNPKKAGLVENIEDFPWSSYRDYKGGKGITDIDFILNVIHSNREKALQLFDKHHEGENNDRCLDIELIDKLTDEEVSAAIIKVFEINSLSDINDVDRPEQDRCLKVIRENYRVSIRQVERLTGISRGMIEKAWA